MMHAAVNALNFYSPVVADQLRHHRKTATIRLGDKSGKYKKGQVVYVLVGQRFGVREKVFDAVIDKVEVKPLREVSPREIQHDNPEIRHIDEFTHFLGQLYNREVTEDATVTVIHFSEIRGLSRRYPRWYHGGRWMRRRERLAPAASTTARAVRDQHVVERLGEQRLDRRREPVGVEAQPALVERLVAPHPQARRRCRRWRRRTRAPRVTRPARAAPPAAGARSQ